MLHSNGASRMINSRIFGANRVRRIGLTSTAVAPVTPYSLQFDGNNDYVNIPTASALQLTGSHSWSMWVKLENVASSQAIITCRDTSTNRQKFGIFKSASNDGTVIFRNQFFIRIVASPGDGGASRKEYVTNGFTTTGWCHLVYTFSTNLLKIYLNGTECTTGASTLTKSVDNTVNTLYNNTSDPIRIGAVSTTPALFAKGFIDQVMLVNKELSSTEVSEIYSLKPSSTITSASSFSFSSNIVAYYPIGEASDVWGGSGGILDRIGTNHGTMTNFDPAGSFSTDVAS